MSDNQTNQAGSLFLVATPIGNLSDITYRAIETLNSVDIIAAEDTRHSKILFNHYNISPKKLTPYHAHNIDKATSRLVTTMLNGESAALVTDAGTPGISDPGAVLVKEAVKAGIVVIPIPGPAAPILALSASGFPTHSFIFEGFLPRKKGRKRLIGAWQEEKRTVLFFESPMRIIKTLKSISEIIGARQVCVARELTKMFEEFIRGDIEEVIENLEKRPSVKGEITVVIAPAGWELFTPPTRARSCR